MALSAKGKDRFTLRPPSSVGSRPFATARPEGRKDLSSLTSFRLHILPTRNWDTPQVDEERAEKLVRRAFDVEPNTEVIIKSFSDHPVRRALVATLSFSQIPTKISQTSQLVQEFEESLEGLSVSLDTHFHGFTPLHSRTSSRYDFDFVALSGLGGHAFGSFKCRDGDYMWVRDDLPFSIPNVRSFIYGYDTELYASTSFQSLEDLGLAFKDALKSLLRDDLENGGPKPLIFLGHSLGGLILKEALCQMSTNPGVDDRLLLKSIRAILFFGTPNQGIDIRSLIPIVEKQANEDFLRSLGTDSVELRRQAQQWSKAFDSSQSDLISNDLEIISYYETSTSPTAVKVDGNWKMSGPRARLVDRSSATHGRSWENKGRFVQPIGRDHSGIVKFRSRNDSAYVNHVLPRLQSYKGLHRHMINEQKSNASTLGFSDRITRQNHQPGSLEQKNRELEAAVKSLEEALQIEKHKTQTLEMILTAVTGDSDSVLTSLGKKKLVIGLDFGTTFSGVAYAFAEHSKHIFRIDTWPGADERKVPKAPTVIKYDEGSKIGLKWGYQVDTITEINIEQFKHLLGPDPDNPLYVLEHTKAKIADSGKDVVDIASDYIRAISQHCLQHIEQSFREDYIISLSKEYVLSVPANWSDESKAMMQRAARKAGIGPITLVKDLEAAARYTFHFNREIDFQVGDVVVVCDAGGSTVDLISYEIMNLAPLELKELVPCSSGLAGSVMLNEQFEQWLQRTVGDSTFLSLKTTSGFRSAVQSFETVIKPGYRGRDDFDKFVMFPGAKLKDDQSLGIYRNSICVTGARLAKFFDHITRDIDSLVREQIDEVRIKRLRENHPKGDSVKAIFLVGGFGSSNYLKQRIEEFHPDIQILQPPDAWSATVKYA